MHEPVFLDELDYFIFDIAEKIVLQSRVNKILSHDIKDWKFN
ncbi:MAG: hypothetical protein ACTSXP_17255 [Promethearchaeota archaeon]